MSASPRPLLTALAALLMLALAQPALAQSDSELRQENQQLRDEVARLQQELATAQARIEELEREVEQLKARQPTGAGGAPPPTEERVSIDETIADASPRALVMALKADYEEALADLEMGDSASSRERIAYLQAVERWSSAAEREFRSNIEWMVRVLRVESATRTDLRLTLQAIDPQYGTALGAPFTAALPRARAQSLEENGMDATYVIRGTLVPAIEVNTALAAPEPFQEDTFIGPYAESTISVDINTMLQKDVKEVGDAGGAVDR